MVRKSTLAKALQCSADSFRRKVYVNGLDTSDETGSGRSGSRLVWFFNTQTTNW